MAPAPRQKPKPGQSSLLSFFAPKAPAQSAPASSSNNGNPNNNTNADKKKIDHGKQPSTHHEHVAESLAIRDAKPDHADRPQGVGEKRSEELLESDNEDEEEAGPAVSRSGRPTKRVSYLYSDEDEEDDVHPPKTPTAPDRLKTPKRKRLMRKIDDEDDEDDDYQPEPSAADHDDDEVMGDSVAESMDEDEPTPKPTKPSRKAPAQSTLSLSPLEQRFKGISVRSPYEPTRENQRQERGQKFKEKNEQRYSWLLDIKDKDKNPIGSPDYDPRTLYVPASAWGKFTPFEKQYWEVKAANWDTIVFFKKGKFYELYEKDADVGHKDFDLKLTERVNMRMVGVPEMSFDYWAAQFIARGHKVAKVDQMETAIGKSMRERNDTKSKADKVIRRELTSVLTAGTLVDAGLLTNDLSTYCMSIKEYCPAPHVPPRFGICFVDSATAEFNLVTINDDVNRTKFETLVTQIQPRELVTEKNCLSKQTARILKNTLNDPIWNQLKAPYDFWDAMHTMDEIRISGYFDEDEESWPEALKQYRNDELVMSAIGGLVSYLRSLKLDRELLSAKNVRVYDPMQKTSSLVLDGQTLANLEIFQNSHDGSEEGTVFKLLNNCTTPFGKRLFRRRLCHPLRTAHAINERLDAVENFMSQSAIVDVLTAAMANLPDLERLISRVHSGRCKVKEFLATLDGFQKMQDIANELRASQDIITARLLQQVVNDFPDMTERLHFFKDAFKIDDVEIDYQKMRVIIPVRGVNSNWDALLDQISAAENEFDEYLLSVKKQLKCAQICYKDMGKEIYQMEVPKGVKVPNDWIQLSSTSKVSRYWDSSIKQMVIRYKELLETKTAYIKNFTSEVYADFDKDYAMWLKAVHHIAEIDVLMGLAKSSANLGEPACRPQIIEQETSVVEFEDLRHPCVVPGVATDFIPNDTTLGGNEPNIIVLTGPNMGGKSTILRQTCVAIIMAQLGCYVPARSCRLTPCDRIYTRIGANDNIMAGQSTFMVELAETSKILHEATPHSMVILDELGRGTSTFDGYAIAYAVLHYLATHVGCLGMFSTHYQTLCREFDRNPSINNMHMGYYMDEDENTVTFLYKLTPGICEKSFGMNVAHMAGVPNEVIKKATQVADQFESQHRLKDTTFGEQQEKKLSPSVLSDFVYLMSKGEDEDIGDVAEDMQTQRGRDTRNTQTMRRIFKGLARAT